MKIIFVYANAVIGGAETLMFRISKRAIERGITVEAYCSSACKEIKQLFEKSNIPIKEYGKILYPRELDISSGDIIITMGSRQYLEILAYLSSKKILAKLFLYIVHPDTVGNWLNGKSLKRKSFFMPIIRDSIYNKNIIFMDEQCWKETVSFYKFDISEDNRIIKRLSITDKEEKKRDDLLIKKRDFTILTIARADYPFKGYVKGLLKIFEQLCLQSEKYIKMVILASGKSIDTLKSWIAENQFKERITLLEDVEYEKLDGFYNHATLYVGMGTTVLEASSFSVPSVVVEYDTYDCRAKGLLCDDPTHVAIDKGAGKDCFELIKKIVDISDEEYVYISSLSRKVIKDYYSADEFIDYVFNTNIIKYKVPLKLRAYLFFRKIWQKIK